MMQNWQKVTAKFWHRAEEGNRNLECPVYYCFSLDFFFHFGGISRQNVMLTSYGFLCFTAWLVYAK